jgi:hypothetical protein
LLFGEGEVAARRKLTIASGLNKFDVRGIEKSDKSDVVAGQTLFAPGGTRKKVGTAAKGVRARRASECCIDGYSAFFGAIA